MALSQTEGHVLRSLPALPSSPRVGSGTHSAPLPTVEGMLPANQPLPAAPVAEARLTLPDRVDLSVL